MRDVKNRRPDEICEEFANKEGQITLKLLDDKMILFEGTAGALHFLGQLFISVANDTKDTGFQISPSGAGKVLFTTDASHGIYIHRLE